MTPQKRNLSLFDKKRMFLWMRPHRKFRRKSVSFLDLSGQMHGMLLAGTSRVVTPNRTPVRFPIGR